MLSESKFTDRRAVRIFNRSCAAVALLYLLIISCIHDVREPGFHDYVQYHLAGSVARAGAWSALYPTPIAGTIYNAGFPNASTETATAVAIAKARGIDPIEKHYMQPPQVALLLIPLGWTDTVAEGYFLWLLISAIAVWIGAVASGRLYERLAQQRSVWSGVLLLLIVFTPATSRAIAVGNVSTLMCAAIAIAILSLDPAQPSPASGAAAIVFSAVVKYAGLLFLPIALRLRAWRTLGWSGAVFLGWSAIALMIMGPGPFRHFLFTIAPTLTRSHEYSDNVSLAGVSLRMLHQLPPLPVWCASCSAIVQLICLAIVLVLLWLQTASMSMESIAAAAASLTSWMLIFSPITWTHYLVYLYPIWGWMIWNARRSRLHAIVTTVAIGIIVISLPTEPPARLDPYGVRYLISLSLTFALGMESLHRTRTSAQVGRPGSSQHYASRGCVPA